METLQRLQNRGSVSTGYDVDNSVKLEPDNTEYLSRTIGSTSNRKTFTVSCWFKRTELKAGAADANGHNLFFSGVDSTNMVSMQFHTWQDTNADKLEFRVVGSTNNYTSRRFRDTSAWYHIVLAVDTTQATESNRWKLYVNGVQETAFDATSYPSQNADTVNNVANNVMRIGTKPYGGNEFGYFAGYIADYYHIDGEALAPTDFGKFDEDSGIWKPKAYTGSFGTNGWYLDFVDGSDLGDDESGNGNDFTENNLAAADQATDTPTNNFCTLNPLVNFKYTTNGITEGGTVFGDDTGGGVGGAFGTMAVTAGKWYWEVKLNQQNAHYIGISAIDDGDNVLSSTDPQEENSTFRFNIGAARREYVNSGSQAYGSLDEFSDFHSAGDIIGIALNMDDNQISIYGNGTLQSGIANSSIFDAANKMVVPFHGTINDECQYNFGGYSAWTPSSAVNDANGYGTFEYAPPSGYYALCTKNLAEFGG